MICFNFVFQGQERRERERGREDTFFCPLSSILILSFTDLQCTGMCACAFELHFCFPCQSFLPVFEDIGAGGDE